MQWSTALKQAGNLLIVIVLIVGGLYYYEYHPHTCSNIVNSYSTQTLYEPTISYSQSYDKIAGVDGVFKVCKSLSGKKVSSTDVVRQVNAVRIEGTYDPVILQPRNDYSGGSVCNDGTYSFSTGRGTCSWHGGVAY